jgi:DNA-binding FadR family transcriptional regulator
MLVKGRLMKKRRRFWTVVEKLEELIDEGVYPAGSRLPPERELAEMYDVSRPTIREAIIALEVRERVEVREGRSKDQLRSLRYANPASRAGR